MICPNCSAPVRDGDQFCGECGGRMPAAGQAAPPPAYSPPPPPTYVPPQQPSYAPPPQPSYSAPPPPAYAPPPQPSYAPAGGYAPAPEKKSRTGCIIAVVVAALLALCCIGPVVTFMLAPSVITEILPPDIMQIIDEMMGTTPTPAPGGLPSGGNQTGTGTQTQLLVVNNLGVDICWLYVSPTSSDSWGNDWLGDSGIISAGQSASFWIESGLTVDIQAVDCDSNVLDEQYDVYIYPEGITYTLDPIQ